MYLIRRTIKQVLRMNLMMSSPEPVACTRLSTRKPKTSMHYNPLSRMLRPPPNPHSSRQTNENPECLPPRIDHRPRRLQKRLPIRLQQCLVSFSYIIHTLEKVNSRRYHAEGRCRVKEAKMKRYATGKMFKLSFRRREIRRRLAVRRWRSHDRHLGHRSGRVV